MFSLMSALKRPRSVGHCRSPVLWKVRAIDLIWDVTGRAPEKGSAQNQGCDARALSYENFRSPNMCYKRVNDTRNAGGTDMIVA